MVSFCQHEGPGIQYVIQGISAKAFFTMRTCCWRGKTMVYMSKFFFSPNYNHPEVFHSYSHLSAVVQITCCQREVDQ